MEEQWLSHYSQTKKELNDIRRQGRAFSDKENAYLLEKMAQLEKSLRILRDSPMEYELSSGEIARRQVIFDNLMKMLTNHSRSTPGTSNGVPSGASTPPIARLDAGVTNPMALSDKALIQRQEQVMKQQDAAMLDIEKGVDRIHKQAVEIGDEVKSQNKIIEELDTHVDVATEGLREETKHAEIVRKKGQVCYMYICIAIEVAIMLVLLFVAFVAK